MVVVGNKIIHKLGLVFFLPSNSCAALFYAVRQFYAMAIFFMGRLDTYGVGQKLWGVAASVLARLHPIAAGPLLYRSKRLTMIFLQY